MKTSKLSIPAALLSLIALPMYGQYKRGVNLSGAEFGEALPGVEGVDYTFNSEATFQYFASKKLTFMRIPIQWERMQPQLNGPLDPNYLAGLKRDVAWAKKYGISIVPEIQNFGRYSINQPGGYQEYIIDNAYAGIVLVPASSLADFWVRMSNEFRNEPTVYAYDLMNEPHDMGTADWKAISQSVLTALRNSGDTKRIMIPGDSWSGAATWVDVHGPRGWITDPANNFEYEAHMSFDDDASGTYADPFDAAAKSRALGAANTFANWCRQNAVHCYVGEYGVPNSDANWLAVLDAALSVLDTAGLDGTDWSSGEYWGDYQLSAQPLANFTKDQPVIAVLERHLGSSASAGQLMEFFYDNRSGRAETDMVNSDDTAAPAAQYNVPPAPWDNIVGLAGGLVLFYQTLSDNAAVGALDASGNFTMLQTLSGFSQWTDVTWVGDNRVAFYNSTNGSIATAAVNPDGSVDTLQGYWGILPVCNRIAGGPGGFFLCYEATSGSAITARVAADGTFTMLQTYQGTFRRTWTHIVEAGFSPQGGLFFLYDESTGNASVGQIALSDGKFTTLKNYTSFASWTHIAGGASLLFYDNLGGASATGTVGANGSFTTFRTFTSLGAAMTRGSVCCEVNIASVPLPSAVPATAPGAAVMLALRPRSAVRVPRRTPRP